MVHTVSLKIGEEELVLETGRMAKQANGAVFARYGGSAVLATVCCSSREMENPDFVPLSVDYNEKYYAAGKIPGGFLKREGRPKDKEILVCRLIDRPMRPLFYKDFGREIQVVPTTISTDQINPPDVLGMMAAFAAVHISDIPFNGPVAAVRIAAHNDEIIVNPTFQQMEEADMDIVVAGTDDGITMVEGGGKEVSEELMLKAIEKAEDYIQQLCNLQKEFAEKAGKEKIEFTVKETKFSREEEIRSEYYSRLEEACFVEGKHNRYAAIKEIKKEAAEKCAAQMEEEAYFFDKLFSDMEREILRKAILDKKVRPDKRGPEDIRKITCETNVLDRTHGSALFTRGETQALAVTTLGTVFDEQIKDDIDGDRRENFMLHYNFPPFSVGETGRMGTGRREIGHGHLAHRAVKGVLPAKESFPYTLRVVSEVLESNGSSSQATVCASSMALMNAGVPLKSAVAGIAMGLIKEGDNTVILSDILGEEDHLGDMDFKVAGTEEGITAFQMDIKISGVSMDIMRRALAQANKGRLHILGIMNETIKDTENMSQYAPKIFEMKVEEDKIGLIIGQGGKTIKAISEQSGARVNIADDGTITIFSKDQASADKAEEMIKGLIEEPEVGRVYHGTVKRVMDFGAFIEIMPGREGLCHISKMATERVSNVEDVVKMNDEVDVRLVEVDKMGRLNLSMVDVDEERWSSAKKVNPRSPRRDGDRRPPRGGRH